MLVPETEIIITNDGAEILRKTVRPGDYVIGRGPECEVRVDIERVSGRHAQLTVNFDHVLIEDLGSGSGTLVGGIPVTESTRVWPNQKIQIGGAIVELHRVKTMPPPDVSLAPSTAAVRRLLPEELLREKKYDIGGVVAQGGMGAILNAKEASIERIVAMKVMLDGSSPNDLTRFVAEAKVTGQLEHPNIVPVHELGVDENDQIYYTMKFVKGITLRKVLEQMAEGDAETLRNYPLPVLLTIFQKVCDAMAFAHSKGVIHRDLKPENIMLGDFGEALVMDWGLAKVIGQKQAPAEDVMRSLVRSLPPGASGATLAGTVMGTPQYMAPEQARGEVDELDVRADIYSLGAILYHILALRPSVTGKDAWTVVAKVSQGAIEPLTAPKNRPVPESLAAVVRKAMAFVYDERYPHVADLQRDIGAYQTGFATSAENAGLGRQLVLLVKRHQALCSTAAAAWLIITALAVWFVINVTRAKQQADKERNVATRERDRAETEKYRAESEKARAEKNLAELRGTAPTFVAQARALVEAGKPGDALVKIGYAIQLDPKNPAYQLQRAHLLEAGQRLAEAATAYHEVLALDPENRPARDNLTLCQRLVGENGGAKELRRDLQSQLVDSLLREGRAVEAGPLAAQIGKGGAAIEATLRARLKEYAAQPGWSNTRLRQLLDGTFEVQLYHLKLGDLSGLRGMPVSSLNLAGTDFNDLKLLAGLPLKTLDISSTPVIDLAPVREWKLETLAIGGTAITDLEPLRGMPLRMLTANSTQITDVSVLAGMPLEHLNLQAVKIKSLDPLRKLPLRHLDLAAAGGDIDMSAFADCRELEEIIISCLACNVESLRALPKLARLRFDTYQSALLPAEKFWAEFKPEMEAVGTINLYANRHGIKVAGAHVANRLGDGTLEINLNRTSVTDLGFLRGLPVSRLAIYDTRVTDLSPLRGMPLTHLSAFSTKVADIEPLRGMPLTEINLLGTNVTSVAPLKDSPDLEVISLPPHARDLDTLRALPKLRLISTKVDNVNFLPDKTAEQFWKEYDAQQKGGAPK